MSRQVLPFFKELCRDEGFGVGEAVEMFMEAALQSKSVKFALDGAARLSESQKHADTIHLETKIADLKSLIEAGRIEFGEALMSGVYKEKEVMGAVDSILRILPRIEDKPVKTKLLKQLRRQCGMLGKRESSMLGKGVFLARCPRFCGRSLLALFSSVG